MKELYAKMLAIQQEIKPIEKDLTNPYYKSKYFDVNTVIGDLRPLLNKHGLVVTQLLNGSSAKEPGAVSSLVLTTTVADPTSGQAFSSHTPLPMNPDPQKQGALITYFRRYALVSIFLMQGEVDDDANSAVEKPKSAYVPRPAYVRRTNSVSVPEPFEPPFQTGKTTN